ncbi:MAG: hypothetical protein ABIW76_00765 [Fibrobacteria bacterium]
MNNRFLFQLLLIAGFAVQAQTINIRGKVSNPAGQAVSGAVVELAERKLKDTTGSDGLYAITGTVGIGQQPLPFSESMALNGSFLELSLSRPQTVELEIFDVHGNLLKREVEENAPAGAHRWNVAENASPNKMLLVKATVGGKERTFRHLPLVGAGYAAQSPASDNQAMAARLTKAAADVDTLTVTASGFTLKKTPLASYDATVNVSLEVSTDIWGGLKNPPVKSAGCGKATKVVTGKTSLMSGGVSRDYIMDIPANYDMNKAYRLFYISHWVNGTAEQMRDGNYYGLKPVVNSAKDTSIFVAPQGINKTWGQEAHPLFDDLTAYLEANLCIDVTRIIAVGFSMGGMVTYSLSTDKQSKIRAGIGMAPANYNIWLPATKGTEPIAWMQSTGMSDNTCPWVSNEAQKRGSKFIAIEKAANNGCTAAEIPTWKSGAMVCYDYQGCKAGYPTRICTFNGAHGPIGATDVWNFAKQF